MKTMSRANFGPHAVVVEDEPLFRDMLIECLNKQPTMQAFGLTGNRRDALRLVKEKRRTWSCWI